MAKLLPGRFRAKHNQAPTQGADVIFRGGWLRSLVAHQHENMNKTFVCISQSLRGILTNDFLLTSESYAAVGTVNFLLW